MTTELDELIAGLALAPTDRRLDALEGEVVRGLAARRGEARVAKAMAPFRLVAVSAATVIGLLAGGALATAQAGDARATGVFATATQLAPSTLLDGAG